MSSLGGLPSLDNKPAKPSAPPPKDDLMSSLFGDEGSADSVTKISEQSDYDMKKLMGDSQESVKLPNLNDKDVKKTADKSKNKDKKADTKGGKESEDTCTVDY